MTEQRHAHQGLPDFHLHGPDNDLNRKGVVQRTKLVTLVLVILMVLGLGRTLYGRWAFADVLAARGQESTLLHVLVANPAPASQNATNTRLALPGTLQGINEALIYSRVNGYVKEWFKDIGDTAKKGEVLAILDIHEVNRQVDEANATYQLTKTAYERWTRLRAQDAVSQQELDEKTGAFRQAEAVLKRLRDQLNYGTVVAPFDGTVTKRNINLGDLVNAGNGGTAQAMFSMAHVDKLHVYVYVPQDRTAQIKVGDNVQILQPSAPERPIIGRIARTAGAIDNTTRTLQVDVEVPNPKLDLLPGSYVEVALKMDSSGALVLPTNTLLFGAGGPFVAVVKDGLVLRKKVTLGIDYGSMVEIKSGVTTADEIILNPPDSIIDGQKIVIETPAPTPKRGS